MRAADAPGASTFARSVSSRNAFGTSAMRSVLPARAFCSDATRFLCGSSSSACSVLPISPGEANSTSSTRSTEPSLATNSSAKTAS